MKNRKNIPTVRVKPSVPYSPSVQPDVQQFEEYRKSFPKYSPLADNFVVTGYDALPPRATQFYAEFWEASTQEDETETAPAMATVEFQPVPKGRTLVVRAIDLAFGLDTDETATGLTLNNSLFIGRNGFPITGATERGTTNQAPRLTVFINGVAQQQYSNLFIDDVLIDGHHLPTYLILSEDEILSLEVIWPLINVAGTGSAEFDMAGAIYGDLLYTKGTDPILEPVNTRSIPVEKTTPEIVDAREIGGQRKG